MSCLPPAWYELAENVNGRSVFGQRGVRDPDGKCEGFDPVEGIDWLGMRITAPGNGRCDSDGHYCRAAQFIDLADAVRSLPTDEEEKRST